MDKNNLTYDEIRALFQADAASIAIESMDVKGYDVYFIDFGPLRGYSYLVFKNDHQITDDFGHLHSYILKERGLAGLRQWYIDTLNTKLFTEEEIAEPLKSYDDYQQKSYFLHNYYAKQHDYMSMFFIGSDEKREERKEKAKEMIFNRVGFCYMDKSLKAFVEKHVALMDKLNAQKDNVADNYEYQKSAFLYEMYNHEYGINLQADWDVLSVFGTVSYEDSQSDINKCFDTLGFTKTQRIAYMDARAEYYKRQQEVA
jgi:hypothetical protein